MSEQNNATQPVLEKLGLARSGVYVIRNTANGKRYVGSAVNIQTRWAHHRWELRAGRHHSQKLQRAWNKYGEASFEFGVLLVCAPCDLLLYEQAYLDFYGSARGGYNVLPAAGSARGYKHSAETRERLSKRHTGKVMSDAMREKCRVRMTGTVWSAESREKVSAAMTGRQVSQETRAKLRARVVPEETRAKIAASLKGHAVSAETIAKVKATKAAKRAAQLADREAA